MWLWLTQFAATYLQLSLSLDMQPPSHAGCMCVCTYVGMCICTTLLCVCIHNMQCMYITRTVIYAGGQRRIEYISNTSEARYPNVFTLVLTHVVCWVNSESTHILQRTFIEVPNMAVYSRDVWSWLWSASLCISVFVAKSSAPLISVW